jgi:hypothetical protein
MTYIDPAQYADYSNMRRKATSAYGQGMAKNAYDVGEANAGYANKRADLIKQFGQVREKLPYGYNKRGILRSGIALRGYQQNASDQLQGLQRAGQEQQSALAGLTLGAQNLNQNYGDDVATAEEYRNRMLQQLAMRLQ